MDAVTMSEVDAIELVRLLDKWGTYIDYLTDDTAIKGMAGIVAVRMGVMRIMGLNEAEVMEGF